MSDKNSLGAQVEPVRVILLRYFRKKNCAFCNVKKIIKFAKYFQDGLFSGTLFAFFDQNHEFYSNHRKIPIIRTCLFFSTLSGASFREIQHKKFVKKTSCSLKS